MSHGTLVLSPVISCGCSATFLVRSIVQCSLVVCRLCTVDGTNVHRLVAFLDNSNRTRHNMCETSDHPLAVVWRS